MAAIIIGDITRKTSFDCAETWITTIRDMTSLKNGSPIPILILANFVDKL